MERMCEIDKTVVSEEVSVERVKAKVALVPSHLTLG
jgi:hypothetical protein